MATIVNISGSGSSSTCYANVNGTKYTGTAQNITLTSNTIVFGVFGYPDYTGYAAGTVTIDGAVVFSAANMIPEEYTWNVQAYVSEVNIVLDDNDGTDSHITVTTSMGGGPSGDETGDHNTNIGNAAREVEGGAVLLGGVMREVESGRTLVNGIAREISFGPSTVPVTIELNSPYKATACYVEIGGTKYTSEMTLEVEIGTNVICYVTTTSQYFTAYVDYNGERKLKSTTANKWVSYAFTIESSLNILMGGHSSAGQIKITTL